MVQRTLQVSACFLALSTVVSAGPRPPVPALDSPGISRLLADGGPETRVRLHRATGSARFVTVRPGSLSLNGSSPEQRAEEFFERYGSIFGVRDPQAELPLADKQLDRHGHTRLTFRQEYQGLAVFAGILRVHFDARERLVAVNGTFVPAIAIDSRPLLDSAAAGAAAVSHVRLALKHAAQTDLVARGARLMVFRAGLVGRTTGRDHLVYEVEVTAGGSVREFVYVDAHDGAVVDRISGIHELLSRKIHEPSFNASVIWSEGDALPYDSGAPTNDAQVNGLIQHSADVFDLFANLSGGGFLSWDGQSGIMHNVWKPSFLSCPNASWNGVSTNYCDGVASDDVVAHEWTHAYTGSTHDLIYQWQPGALNEAYSDIFGEIVDLIDGAGSDSPGPVRTPGDCSTFGGNPPASFVVDSPPGLAGPYPVAGANFNPSFPVSASAPLQRANDGNDEGGAASVSDACQALIGFVPGRIALIDRGTCSFSSKAVRAQNAGASAMILVNSQESTFAMSGSDLSITIPSVMIAKSHGDAIKAQLASGVSGTVALDDATAVSLRWLVGEDSTGFGGAIRDLWNPACFGDPAKVVDPRYACSTGDGGGVHTNSGVPNHAFALLVDGGVFNGQTVAGIGLTKAAHVYWRAMHVYQVPDSDFADHADALAQSCADLIGLDLASLTTGASSGEVLAPADCAELAKATLATEMALDPPCNFSPLLQPDPPPFACGTVALFDDFETDPAASWTYENSGVFAEYTPRDWAWTPNTPAGGSGPALFALDDRDLGNCVEGDDDQSGVMSATSPAIPLSGAAALAFKHNVATESGFDGGNLRISVNGGTFAPIAASAFLFNPYNATLVSAPQNTSPLAGQAAFSGTDGGEVNGSWGQSQLLLGAYAGTGDTIQLRFDFGVDGCNGVEGWYLDDVLVCTDGFSAGRVPDGHLVSGPPLTVQYTDEGEVTLTWGASCHVADGDYEVYEGVIGDFSSHAPRFCSTAGATTQTFLPAPGATYYLVVPRNGDREGSYGTDSAGTQRSPSASACLAQNIAPGCGG